MGTRRGLDHEGGMSELEGCCEAVTGQLVTLSQRSCPLKSDVARVLARALDRQTDSLSKRDSLDRNHIEDQLVLAYDRQILYVVEREHYLSRLLYKGKGVFAIRRGSGDRADGKAAPGRCNSEHGNVDYFLVRDDVLDRSWKRRSGRKRDFFCSAFVIKLDRKGLRVKLLVIPDLGRDLRLNGNSVENLVGAHS